MKRLTIYMKSYFINGGIAVARSAQGDSSGAVQLQKALRVLDALAELDRRNGVPLQQIAEYVQQNKSSVYRWLQAFRGYGLVEQDPQTEAYRLGLKVLHLSGKLLDLMDLRKEAAPILHDLMEQAQNTVHLGIYDRGEVVYLEKLNGPSGVLMRSQVGGRMPVYCTGVGKAMLAFLPMAEIQNVLDAGLQRRTPNTIIDPHALLRHLEEIRLRRYAVDNEENELDVRCVAAPIFNHVGQVVGGLSVAGLAGRFSDERLLKCSVLVRAASEALSARLGYRPASLAWK